MLENLFISVLNMSLVAGYATIFVLIARLLLKKAPKIFSYALWGIVLFRLLCPISFESVLSLMPMEKSPIPQDIIYSTSPQISMGVGIIDNAINPLLPMQGNVVNSVNPIQIWILIGSVIWVLGILAMLIYSLVAFVKLRRSLIGATRLKENIYLADHISSPFVMGLFRPKIYLPSSLSEHEMEFVIAHERCHIRRFDHVTRILGFAALAIHWFHPLVWIAFILSGKDMELSCDEAVMKQMDTDIRGEYSQSLLRFGTAKGMIHATPLAFGEGDTKSRVKNVLNYKKPAFWIVAVAIVAVAALAVVLVSNPAPKKEQEEIANATQALLAQNSSYTVVEQSYVGGNGVLLLAAAPNPMVPEENMSYGVFAMEETDGVYTLAASAECDPSMSLGFSAALLKWNGLTVVFGDLGERYWNFRTDEVTPAEYTSVRVLYEGGEQSLSVTNNAPYLAVIEGDVQLKDIEYYAGDMRVTGYAENYSGSPSSILTRELTKDEIDRVNEAFETLLPAGDAAAAIDPDGEFMLNPILHFFTSYYEIPSHMDMGKFVYYMPRESYLTVKDAAEIETLKETGQQLPFEHIEDSPVPFGRIPFATVEQSLQKYMNVSLGDMTNMGDALYSEEYKTFYSPASDFGPGVFQCTSGQTNGNLVTLYSDIEHAELTLRKEGESYFIFSHVPSAKQ